MANVDFDDLIADINVIKNETRTGANTAERVGSVLLKMANMMKSMSGLKHWVGTQAEYNALPSIEDDTVYIIK